MSGGIPHRIPQIEKAPNDKTDYHNDNQDFESSVQEFITKLTRATRQSKEKENTDGLDRKIKSQIS